MPHWWTEAECQAIAEAWKRLGSLPAAVREVATKTGVALSAESAKYALASRGITASSLGLPSARYHSRKAAPVESTSRDLPSAHPAADALMGAFGMVPVPAQDENPAHEAPVAPKSDVVRPRNSGDLGNKGLIQQLVSEARRQGATLERVCNALDVSPARLQRLVEEAKSQGLAIELHGEAIGVRAAPPSDTPVDVAPVVGDEQIIAAISDTHAGSRYAQRSQLRDFIHYAYSLGVRQVAHSGDWLDGCYDHGRFELSHHGIDEQAQDAIETLPRLDGLSYWGICGNHDQTFTAKVGVEVGPYIEQRFKSAGRSDVHMVGNAGAYLRIRGALVHLWHPKGGVPYAISYRLQKQVEAYSPGLKPDILLTGHLHKFGRIVERGVHAFCVPCFQGPGSAFSNSLVGQPALGGLILRWRLTANGTLRSVSDELVSYYHNEQARQVA